MTEPAECFLQAPLPGRNPRVLMPWPCVWIRSTVVDSMWRSRSISHFLSHKIGLDRTRAHAFPPWTLPPPFSVVSESVVLNWQLRKLTFLEAKWPRWCRHVDGQESNPDASQHWCFPLSTSVFDHRWSHEGSDPDDPSQCKINQRSAPWPGLAP